MANDSVYLFLIVFLPEFKYKEITRKKRDLSRSEDEEARVQVPVEVRFKALGREFHFYLEAAEEPFTEMSLVLVRRSVIDSHVCFVL